MGCTKVALCDWCVRYFRPFYCYKTEQMIVTWRVGDDDSGGEGSVMGGNGKKEWIKKRKTEKVFRWWLNRAPSSPSFAHGTDYQDDMSLPLTELSYEILRASSHRSKRLATSSGRAVVRNDYPPRMNRSLRRHISCHRRIRSFGIRQSSVFVWGIVSVAVGRLSGRR